MSAEMAGLEGKRVFILKAILFEKWVLMNTFCPILFISRQRHEIHNTKKYKPWKQDEKLDYAMWV